MRKTEWQEFERARHLQTSSLVQLVIYSLKRLWLVCYLAIARTLIIIVTTALIYQATRCKKNHITYVHVRLRSTYYTFIWNALLVADKSFWNMCFHFCVCSWKMTKDVKYDNVCKSTITFLPINCILTWQNFFDVIDWHCQIC